MLDIMGGGTRREVCVVPNSTPHAVVEFPLYTAGFETITIKVFLIRGIDTLQNFKMIYVIIY
jgi:hypothetical protein